MSQREFVPPFTDATAPYWDGTRNRQLMLQYCPACGRYVHHPREACPGCLSSALEWRASPGFGAVHAISVHYKPFEVMSAEECPYAVVFIDLDEGVRFLANVTADGPLEGIDVGDRVRLGWREVGGGYHVPVFHAGGR